jgi:hypothetical protein
MIEILFIVLGSVVCLAGILGGTSIIMRISERKYVNNLAKTDRAIPGNLKTLDELFVEDKYQDKLVAISNEPEKRIVASADTYSELLKEARKAAKNSFCVLFVPKKGMIYSR